MGRGQLQSLAFNFHTHCQQKSVQLRQEALHLARSTAICPASLCAVMNVRLSVCTCVYVCVCVCAHVYACVQSWRHCPGSVRNISFRCRLRRHRHLQNLAVILSCAVKEWRTDREREAGLGAYETQTAATSAETVKRRDSSQLDLHWTARVH